MQYTKLLLATGDTQTTSYFPTQVKQNLNYALNERQHQCACV